MTLACTSSPCHDTGLAPGTTFTYTVVTSLGAWRARSATATATTTTGLLAVTGHQVNGSGKTRLSGTAPTASQVDVALCRATVPVCTATTPGYVETATATPTSAGAWTTSPTAAKLVTGTTYTATATQGAAISAPYAFTP